jgi:hypothetical protein
VKEKTGTFLSRKRQGIGNPRQKADLGRIAQVRHMLDEGAVAIEDESGWRFHAIPLCE